MKVFSTAFSRLLALTVTSCTLGLVPARAAPAPDFWKFASPQELPFETEILSQREENGLVWKEFYFTSEVVNGEKYRIYSLYAAPKNAVKVPAVLLIHGAGGTAEADAVEAWAKRGYACLSYDWWGNPKDKNLNRPQYSRFGAGTDLETTKFQFTSPPRDSRTYHSIIAARRAISWLQSQPEVDAAKIGVHGVSWGGFHSLILSGIDDRVKADVTVYGAGFYQGSGINNGTFGLTGPLKFLPVEQQQAWLDAFDPEHYLTAQPPRFLMTGTNDIFFWLPLVQKTYDAIPGEKRLWLEPNVNHSIHTGFKDRMYTAAARWFDYELRGQGEAPPVVGEVQLTGNKTTFALAPAEKTPVNAVLHFLWIKQKPLGTRLSGSYNNREARWESVVARKTEVAGQWEATLPEPPAEALGVDVFANVTTADGVTLSSAVVEQALVCH